MRLTCPNCNAQYEVPVDVIPEAGRDVQCSNCGHTWFQHHPDFAPDPEDADDLLEAPTEDAPDAEPDPEDGLSPQQSGPETPAGAKRRGLDPSVAEVLREEAQREAEARRADSGGLESQPELGLDSASETEEERRTRQARERMAKMRGPAGDGATTAADRPTAEYAEAAPAPPPPRAERAAGSSRSEMLPDIDEINQTLRAATDRRPTETPEGRAPEATDDGRSGFSRGMAIGILIAVLALALYIFAAPIAEAVPALAPFLDAYVAQANDLRVWLQATLEGLAGMIGGAAEAPRPDT
ncbi:MJ0042 family finger-like domain-containing protein [Roseivivax lentus]|uniref:MJ0042 family finger-like domain-containing protein n=1 Tax=Roseivivax lentus TaxID=633194 RepID=A0A1N7K2L0_9RHOB|nr:zinc-ribbon domain-containing protein [Roseivivax lentus]SIS55787.1 MJ0042 family finger-like domain-containing protein [Roseivivax lentus]